MKKVLVIFTVSAAMATSVAIAFAEQQQARDGTDLQIVVAQKMPTAGIMILKIDPIEAFAPRLIIAGDKNASIALWPDGRGKPPIAMAAITDKGGDPLRSAENEFGFIIISAYLHTSADDMKTGGSYATATMASS
ncbi:MAG: hypothetical protein PHW24_03070 [Candidatus Moranbacteria bacterium]|nr:hypothetical protein [Candidatus Moranbacteria bacterium]